jgi:hypothetical protein
MIVLAILYAGLAALTAAVGSFADGGDIFSRLVLVLLHPLAAVALLLLVLRTTTSTRIVLGIATLLLATVAADAGLAAAIASGEMKGDWELPLIFAVVPSLGAIYALFRAIRSARSTPS